MPTVERIETWRGQDVVDGVGEKAGRLEDVYYDSGTEEPILLSVKRGMLGRQVTLVPAADAVLSRDYVRVPYSAEQIGQAGSSTAEDELSAEQVASVGARFKVTLQSPGPLFSASLIHQRRVEAEEANRRARELEREAQQRAEELEEARERAGEAAAEAQSADRAREKAEAAAFGDSRHPPGTQ